MVTSSSGLATLHRDTRLPVCSITVQYLRTRAATALGIRSEMAIVMSDVVHHARVSTQMVGPASVTDDDGFHAGEASWVLYIRPRNQNPMDRAHLGMSLVSIQERRLWMVQVLAAVS
ncbi:hypothetical protein PDE_07677 [Penicillium oxalicum 114-2]|uniref:Uncharacterized protein n=1 Tax=Penicillium oxalicum (strain 114-2 / CGMCC 5302) TaxID=933388 RepID=S8BCP6_PENO1|nr:hypothetical protein PDE_07677 [Penicillium oxalicum 114-2]